MLDLLHQSVRWWTQQKKFFKEIKSVNFIEHVDDKKSKQPYGWYEQSFSGPDIKSN